MEKSGPFSVGVAITTGPLHVLSKLLRAQATRFISYSIPSSWAFLEA